MRRLIYLFLIAVITVALLSCAKSVEDKNLNQTGMYDQSGNLISDTLIYTNQLTFTGNIPIWATNIKIGYIIKTNIVNITKTNYQVSYESNYYLPSYPERPTDYYRVRVPYAGGGDYYTVSYRDVQTLKQLWLNQIKRNGAGDGRVFAIRNKENNGGFLNENDHFQSLHDGRYDYYYFKDNGDIVYKGGDKNSKTGETLVKRYIGAVIVDYRTVEKRWNQSSIHEPDKIKNTGEWTIGAIYKMAITVNEARDRFASEGLTDGVYDFIAARKEWWYWKTPTAEDKTVFERQYYNTDFLEVLVLNPHANENWESCLGIDAYYAYYGDYRAKSGEVPVKGFTEKNMPYMTDEYAYLGQRPEYIVPLLDHTTTFTDASRRWKYLAVPGHAN